MSNAKTRKLQHLLIKQLLETGRVELLLPDGITVEIGIVQENKHGDLIKTDDYCYVVATRGDRSAMIDSYNLGLQFEDRGDSIIYEGTDLGDNGAVVKYMDVV